MEIALTGASGFLGRHLVSQLGEDPGLAGDFTLRTLSRRPPAEGGGRQVEQLTGDLLDPAACHRLVRAGSVVVNLAYHAAGTRSDNLRMAENLAAACRQAGARRLLHCSTAVVAGRAAGDVVTEETACQPVSAYERTKLEIEGLLVDALDGCCPVTVLRPTAVFGTGGRNLVRFADELTRKGRLHAWIKAALLGDRRLHLVCVETVVAAVGFLLRRPPQVASELFIVSDDEAPENNYRDITALLADALELDRPPTLALPGSSALLALLLRLAGRSDANPRRIYSCRKLLAAGFEKPLTLATGVRRFASAYAQGRHL
jgi:nucleoside-diphosphate-sugar epimerase